MPSNDKLDFKVYQSPMSYRYGSDEMRAVWSEQNRHLTARDIWIAVANAQMKAGLVTEDEYRDLLENREELEIETILSREMDRSNPRFVGHETVAAISHYKDKASVGGRIIHQGLTSDDILSNVEILQIKESLSIIERGIVRTLEAFSDQIESCADIVCVGWTHLQPAEPTTVGYRLSRYAQDFVNDLMLTRLLKDEIKGKGIKGAVGTSASFSRLLGNTEITASAHEEMIMDQIGLDASIITGQTYPRKYAMWTMACLSSIGQSCHQFASDLKVLQSAAYGEWAQPSSGVGSSAMPHKKNPSTAETIKSLARGLPGKFTEAWIAASEVTLERGLEDSAGKRSYLPESFLIVDEILTRTSRIVRGLEISEESIKLNLGKFGPFMALEIILGEATKRGADRQEIHRILSELASEAWSKMGKGEKHDLVVTVASDPRINEHLSFDEVRALFTEINDHVGDASSRCVEFLSKLRSTLGNNYAQGNFNAKTDEDA